MATAAQRSAAPRRAPATVKEETRLGLVTGRPRSKRRRVPELLADMMVLASLIAVVIGHDMLAQGQLRLGSIQTSLTQEQAIHSATVIKVAAMETPSRISSEASSLHLTEPAQILQLPTVSLMPPLPPAHVVPVAPSAR